MSADPVRPRSVADDTSERTGRSRTGRRPSWVARALIFPVRVWQWSAPARMPRCRFHPTCSAYAVGALREHGALRGAWLALRRLARCHPWNPGGIDPVPPSEDR